MNKYVYIGNDVGKTALTDSCGCVPFLYILFLFVNFGMLPSWSALNSKTIYGIVILKMYKSLRILTIILLLLLAHVVNG